MKKLILSALCALFVGAGLNAQTPNKTQDKAKLSCCSGKTEQCDCKEGSACHVDANAQKSCEAHHAAKAACNMADSAKMNKKACCQKDGDKMNQKSCCKDGKQACCKADQKKGDKSCCKKDAKQGKPAKKSAPKKK